MYYFVNPDFWIQFKCSMYRVSLPTPPHPHPSLPATVRSTFSPYKGVLKHVCGFSIAAIYRG